jgi:hypothetical protein
MSKETLLNRQFTEREVQRMRNIVMDKHGDKTRSQIGYENTQQHIEGARKAGIHAFHLKDGIDVCDLFGFS